MAQALYRLFVLVCLVSMTSSFKCPRLCRCNPKQLAVYCSHNQHIKRIPRGIPTTTRSLYVSYNDITQITNEDFKGLFNLRTLSLKKNGIATIAPEAFSDLVQLETLYLTANYLTGFPDDLFINQGNLTHLYLGQNKLTAIPNLENCTCLKKLFLAGNELENCFFPSFFKNLTRLQNIVLSHNKIAHINFIDFESLQSSPVSQLFLSGCDIKRVEPGAFKWFSQLVSLKLSNTHLSTLNLRNVLEGLGMNRRLNSLNLDQIALDNNILPSDIFKPLENGNLLHLTMSRNKITVLKEGTFKYLKNLQQLQLRFCNIEHVDPNAFEGLSCLKDIRMKSNMLTSVPENLPASLQSIDLSHNAIDEITNSDLQRTQQLTTLYLNSNKIRIFHQKAFLETDNLQVLDLSYNNIASIGNDVLSPLDKLVFLKLSHNKINQIPTEVKMFSRMNSLQHLDLSHNDCDIMPLHIFSDLKNLATLLLQGNELGKMLLGDVDGDLFARLTKLQELHLEANGMTDMPQLLFKNLPSLKYLYLNNNIIRHWGRWTFQGAPQLQRLDMSYNQISVINQSSISSLKAIKVLNLTGNPFACTCDLVWFGHWINSTNVKLPNLHQYTCNSPQEREGLLLTEFDPDALVCTIPNWRLYLIIACCSFALVFIIGSLCLYRYRWKIRLRLLKLKLMRGRRRRNMDEQTALLQYIYDAYISFCPEDEEWIVTTFLPMVDMHHEQQEAGRPIDENRRYKIFYEKRDGLPNRSDEYNMCYAMERSRKVLLVLSKEYLKVSLSASFENVS